MGLIGRWFKQIEVSGIRNPKTSPAQKMLRSGGKAFRPGEAVRY
jgi:hypothetical protein